MAVIKGREKVLKKPLKHPLEIKNKVKKKLKYRQDAQPVQSLAV